MAIPIIVAAPSQNQKELPYLCDEENEMGKGENAKRDLLPRQDKGKGEEIRNGRQVCPLLML